MWLDRLFQGLEVRVCWYIDVCLRWCACMYVLVLCVCVRCPCMHMCVVHVCVRVLSRDLPLKQ